MRPEDLDVALRPRSSWEAMELGTALLRRRSGESKELERIETEAHRLDSMINDLLVMSRNQAKNALVSETVKANQLWSEVLDAESVEWFKENGGLKRENGDHFRKTLLSQGGSQDAMKLFRDFAGHDPKIEPLLEKRGLTAPEAATAPRQAR